MLVAVRAIPLQAACLALLPAPWALPRLVDLQLASSVSALDGSPSGLAIPRSARLLAGRRWAYGVPFIGLLLAGRLAAAARAAALASLPPRIVRGVPELALAVWLGGAVVSLALARAGDVLPLAARERFAREEGGKGE